MPFKENLISFQVARFVEKESRSGDRSYRLSALWILLVGVGDAIRRHHRAYEK